MDAAFWHAKWSRNEIAFHAATVNPFLRRHLPSLGVAPGARIFVPLCGKSLDLGWLCVQGFEVVGAELSRAAVDQLFAELGVEPQIEAVGPLLRYRGPAIEVFVGDVYDLSVDRLGHVDAVYDRAAIVALPQAMRERYARHLTQLTAAAPQLVICFEYDQERVAGPPFSIDASAIRALYATEYAITMLERVEVTGGLKGVCPAHEAAWLLRPAA